MVDGGGLCSPGRWAIDRRRLPDCSVVRDIRDTLFDSFKKCIPSFDKGFPRRELLRLACGQNAASQFKEDDIGNARRELRTTLARHGFCPGIPEPEDRPQHFEVCLVGELAKACTDPDMDFCPVWAEGCGLAPRAAPAKIARGLRKRPSGS